MQAWSVLHTARWKCRMQKIPQNLPSGHHSTTLLGCIFATKACVDNRKNLLNINFSSRCSHNMANFGRLAAEIGSGVWGTPANFSGFRVLPSLLQWRHSPEASQTLHTFLGAPAPWQNFPGAKFTLRPSLAFSYIGSITKWHSSSWRQPNFAAWYTEWNYGTFAEGASYIWLGGHHTGHRPTF